MAIHRQLTLCRRMRAMRESAEMTQADVAARLGISQAAYCRLEKGEIEVTLTKLLALSELYGVSLVKLLESI